MKKSFSLDMKLLMIPSLLAANNLADCHFRRQSKKETYRPNNSRPNEEAIFQQKSLSTKCRPAKLYSTNRGESVSSFAAGKM
jgi:hypothetical protein